MSLRKWLCIVIDGGENGRVKYHCRHMNGDDALCKSRTSLIAVKQQLRVHYCMVFSFAKMLLTQGHIHGNVKGLRSVHARVLSHLQLHFYACYFNKTPRMVQFSLNINEEPK